MRRLAATTLMMMIVTSGSEALTVAPHHIEASTIPTTIPGHRCEPLIGSVCRAATGTGPSAIARGLSDTQVGPRIEVGTVSCTAGLTVSTVKRYVHAYLKGLRWCYQDRLQRRPDLQGTVTLGFTIMDGGHTRESTLTSVEVSDEALASCFRKKVKRWRFPKPNGASRVTVAAGLTLSVEE